MIYIEDGFIVRLNGLESPVLVVIALVFVSTQLRPLLIVVSSNVQAQSSSVDDLLSIDLPLEVLICLVRSHDQRSATWIEIIIGENWRKTLSTSERLAAS